MKVKELIRKLKSFDPDAGVLISSDEELNTLYWGIEVAKFMDGKIENGKFIEQDHNEIVIFGLSGQEKEQLS